VNLCAEVAGLALVLDDLVDRLVVVLASDEILRLLYALFGVRPRGKLRYGHPQDGGNLLQCLWRRIALTFENARYRRPRHADPVSEPGWGFVNLVE
jgi:hypothetical protein